jgi:hypothetical protein
MGMFRPSGWPRCPETNETIGRARKNSPESSVRDVRRSRRRDGIRNSNSLEGEPK